MCVFIFVLICCWKVEKAKKAPKKKQIIKKQQQNQTKTNKQTKKRSGTWYTETDFTVFLLTNTYSIISKKKHKYVYFVLTVSHTSLS